MKKALKILLAVLLAVITAALCLVAWLSVTEFRPKSVEPLAVTGGTEQLPLKTGEELKILCWNIGYGGLGKDSDFFMDGGENVKSADEATVKKYLDGIQDTVEKLAPQLIMLQEVDSDSSRSYGIDQREYFGGSYAFGNDIYLKKYQTYSGLYSGMYAVMGDNVRFYYGQQRFLLMQRTAEVLTCLLQQFLTTSIHS